MKQNYVTLLHKKSSAHTYLIKAFTPILAGLMFSLANAPALAAEDDYLRTLQAEASDSTPVKIAANDDYLDALSAEAEASAKVSSDRKNTADQDRLEMEALLKEEKPTSYKYYKKLKPHEKKKLAEAYRADSADKETKLDHLRHKILDLYFKR